MLFVEILVLFHNFLTYMVPNRVCYLQKFLSYFKPPEKASGSVISFFLSEGNTDEEIAYFRVCEINIQ